MGCPSHSPSPRYLENGAVAAILTIVLLFSTLTLSAQVEEEEYYEESDHYEQGDEDEGLPVEQYEYIEEEWEYEPPENAVPRREKEAHDDVMTYSESDLDRQEVGEEEWKVIIGEQDYNELDPEISPEDEEEAAADNESTSVSPIWRWLLIGLIAGVFIYLIVKLTQQRVTSNLRVEELDLATLDHAEANIHESDLEALLRLAIEGRDYRSALRVRYLMVLRKLDEKGWIEHLPAKTSMSYIIEMDGRTQQATFRELSRIFDYVWYAEVEVPAEDDRMFARRFSDYMSTIDD